MAGVVNEIEVAARTLGLQLQLVPAASADDFAGAFAAMSKGGAQGLLVFPSPMLFAEYRRIAGLAAESRLPAMGAAREFADLGGLMSYGVNLPDLSRRGPNRRICRWSNPHGSSWSSISRPHASWV